MKGEWIMIRLKPRGREKNENWLLRKIEDEHAGGSDDLVERCLTSVATGRTMAEIAEGKPAQHRGVIRAPSRPRQPRHPRESGDPEAAPDHEAHRLSEFPRARQ